MNFTKYLVLLTALLFSSLSFSTSIHPSANHVTKAELAAAINGVNGDVTNNNNQITNINNQITNLNNTDNQLLNQLNSLNVLINNHLANPGHTVDTDTDTHANLANIEQSINDINLAIDQLEDEVSGLGAQSAALAGLPQAMTIEKNMLSIGVGHYRGTNAVAFGYSRRCTERFVTKFGIAISDGSANNDSFNASAGYEF